MSLVVPYVWIFFSYDLKSKSSFCFQKNWLTYIGFICHLNLKHKSQTYLSFHVKTNKLRYPLKKKHKNPEFFSFLNLHSKTTKKMGHKFKYPQRRISMILILFSTSVQTLTLFFVMIIVFSNVRILCSPREILSFQVHFETFPEENYAYVGGVGAVRQISLSLPRQHSTQLLAF